MTSKRRIKNYAFVATFLLTACNNQLVRESPSTDMYSAVPVGSTPSLDTSLGFHPKRLWRLMVRWEPNMADRRFAWVQKDFQLYIEDLKERTQLLKEIKEIGGEALYLSWLQTQVSPVGRWDRLLSARVTQLKDSTVVTLSYRSEKPVPIEGDLTVEDVSFPGMPSAIAGCASGDFSFMSESIDKDYNIAFEVVLFSRRIDLLNKTYSAQVSDALLPLRARLWVHTSEKNDRVQLAERSHLLGDRVIYRAGLRISPPFARCPIRPEDIGYLSKVTLTQPMGVEW